MTGSSATYTDAGTLGEPTRVNIGPLTTIFTPPSSCSSLFGSPTYHWDSAASSVYDAVVFQGVTCSSIETEIFTQPLQTGSSVLTQVVRPFLNLDPNCWPLSIMPDNVDGGYGAYSAPGFYSPGAICPSGYTTACSAIIPSATGTAISNVTSAANFNFMWSLLPDETAVGCCPSGYRCSSTYDGREQQTCVSVAFAGEIITTFQCLSGKPSAVTNAVPTGGLSMLTVTGKGFSGQPLPITFTDVMSGVDVSQYAPLVQLVRKASDPPFRTITSRSNGGLLAGTKIAIGVAIPITALTLIIALTTALLWRRKLKRRRANSALHYEKPELDSSGTSEKPSNAVRAVELPAFGRCHELDPQSIQELGPEDRQELDPEHLYELAVQNVVYELDDGERKSMSNTDAVITLAIGK